MEGLAQVVLETPHHHPLQILLLDRHPAGEAGGIEELQQGGEAVAVAVVGRGERNSRCSNRGRQIPQAAREARIDGIAQAVARRRRVVGLIEDQQAL